ncbi:hypothetical protein RFI_07152 [Reticulomyxa filosa]|uniref:STEEP1 domain-containing protein n=1 Tax=Reticulomyxa filosa TaxID=46433 RepID=X6NUJ4_RETFI|nr:hypothetical protein RFI_07152 [Reticulomyxa filosa]|eukprot:ETO29970.1 hypothetical protein RFI_07152 [Reticulomyxa filosa]
MEREQHDKLEYRRRLRDEKEFVKGVGKKKKEQYRQNARFAQTDYSSFDSEVADKYLERYWCAHCGRFAMVMETSLFDCLIRKQDESYCVDISTQVFRTPGLYEGGVKVLRRQCVVHVPADTGDNKAKEKELDNAAEATVEKTVEALEIQYRMNCRSCALPILYRHKSDRNSCNRVFVFNDALSNDPTVVTQKIEMLKESLAIAKGLASASD